VLGRYVGLLLDSLLGRVEHFLGYAHVVAHGENEPRRPIVEHEATSMKLVVDVRGRDRRPAAHDRLAQRGRDVTGGCPGAKHAGRIGRQLPLLGSVGRQPHRRN
jgi:hypothetical protein